MDLSKGAAFARLPRWLADVETRVGGNLPHNRNQKSPKPLPE